MTTHKIEMSRVACDRCNQELISPKNTHPVNWRKITTEVVGFNIKSHFDLCPECEADFVHWLRKYGKQKL